MKAIISGAAMVIVATALVVAGAQSIPADERAIRSLIAVIDSGETVDFTTDNIFWTGALKRPWLRGKNEPERMPGLENRVSSRIKTSVVRIDVSKSGDMAYEFSDVEVTNQAKDADGRIQTTTFPSSLLRVWKKVDGKWQVAAHFQRRHEQ